ncbi:unnamed protein product [Prorocentrum cordatum]|uniref:Ribosome biogenesis protein NOP53 n=1 Tax=Prorocentrum cordatum TaxID=2364126 RepID=A0ABN9U8K9_9DINO|nr:unnamed protein product [Polarella glacialis]
MDPQSAMLKLFILPPRSCSGLRARAAARQEEKRLKRALREAEGGRAGGFNDRQDLQVDRKPPPEEDDCEYDDFGRRKKRRPESQKRVCTDPSVRRAMEKLRQKTSRGGRSRPSRVVEALPLALPVAQQGRTGRTPSRARRATCVGACRAPAAPPAACMLVEPVAPVEPRQA